MPCHSFHKLIAIYDKENMQSNLHKESHFLRAEPQCIHIRARHGSYRTTLLRIALLAVRRCLGAQGVSLYRRAQSYRSTQVLPEF